MVRWPLIIGSFSLGGAISLKNRATIARVLVRLSGLFVVASLARKGDDIVKMRTK